MSLFLFSVFFTYFMMGTDIGSTICKVVINGVRFNVIKYIFQCPYCMSFHIFFWTGCILRYNIIDCIVLGLVSAWSARMAVKYGM